MGQTIERTKDTIDRLALRAKDAITKASDAVTVAAKSAGGKVREAAVTTGGKLGEAGKKIEGAGRTVAERLGAPPPASRTPPSRH